ncbi:protein-glutamine gamma-glutamyltransferase [Cohnella sp. AR92]|uniref:protein-glutamine gamma-glutamyltransferase n=1 Tax=Cohnella sp. AR92 TaxID=648716 RepID=UPI000F8F64B5|nr:protein-glutamine gamma-glutamyltransferase [Cohnella sp. AR92]RUS46935.1 protein-glutamine gamma-glutamyltransferase [Cohnella sp. AR92]
MNFEDALRSNIVAAAREMSTGGTRFATFRTSFCNKNYWYLTNNGGFHIRDGVSPSKGIRDIFSNGSKYGFECATAVVILFYKGVLDTIGSTKFNELFGRLLLHSWDTDADLGVSSAEVSASYGRPGDCLYFKNPDVNPEKMEWQGENVIMLDQDLYYGHGVGIRSANDIINALNRRRRSGADRSAYLEDLIVYPDYDYLSQFAPSDLRQSYIGLPFPPGLAAVKARIGGRRTLRM